MSNYSEGGSIPDPTVPVYDDISVGTTGTTPVGTTGTGGGKKDTAKQEAAGVAHDAADATRHVAGTAKEQAKNVGSETLSQVRGLVDQAGAELKSQASTQQERAAKGIRSVSDELKSMASNSETSGPASQVVHSVADRVDAAADWLQNREPSSLLSEVKSFAARRPGTFIAIATLAGVVAGRLTSSLVAEAKSETPDAGYVAPATSTTPPPPAFDDLVEPAVPPVSSVPPVPPAPPATGTSYPGTYEPGTGYEGGRL
jgi:hypothetical protein